MCSIGRTGAMLILITSPHYFYKKKDGNNWPLIVKQGSDRFGFHVDVFLTQ